MALPNGDLITTVFDPQMAYPVDKRMQVDTLNSRDSISMYIRWEGMTVYVLENSKIYILQGGRSNEYWKELGTGTGTGGTTFVGQFESADLLPTSGRSAGDYAFVGTGDDFVQYNWDNISNQWVMAEGQTDLASEHFHIGYKTPLRRPVIFRRDPKDVIIDDSGDIIIDTNGEAAIFILTGEVESVIGIVSATDGREIHLTNRTGSDVLLVDEYTSTDAENRFNIGSDYTLSNGETISLKSEDDRWVLGYVNTVAFSDHLDSVGAVRSIGPDGLEVISNIFDRHTGKNISMKKVTTYMDGSVMDDTKIDGLIYSKIDSDYFKKVIRTVDLNILGVKIENTAEQNAAAFNAAQSNFPPDCRWTLETGTYKINNISINKSGIYDFEGITFKNNEENTTPAIRVENGVDYVSMTGLNLIYEGQFYVSSIGHTGAYGPQKSGIVTYNNKTVLTGIRVTGFSFRGIDAGQENNGLYLNFCICSNNGYGGAASGGYDFQVVGGEYNENGGSNSQGEGYGDGYGIVANVREKGNAKIIGVTACRNRTRNIDSHTGQDIIIQSNYVEEAGVAHPQWFNQSFNRGHNIRLEQRIRRIIVSGNISKKATGAGIMFQSAQENETQEWYAESIIMSGNYLDDNSYANIWIRPEKTHSVIISSNKCASSEGSLTVDLLVDPQTHENGTIQDLKVADNYFSRFVQINLSETTNPHKSSIKLSGNTFTSFYIQCRDAIATLYIGGNDFKDCTITSNNNNSTVAMHGNFIDRTGVSGTLTMVSNFSGHSEIVGNKIANSTESSIFSMSSNTRFEKNRFYNCQASNRIITTGSLTNATIIDNYIHSDCSATDIIRFNPHKTVVVKDNIFTGRVTINHSAGFQRLNDRITFDPINKYFDIGFTVSTLPIQLGDYVFSIGDRVKNNSTLLGGPDGWFYTSGGAWIPYGFSEKPVTPVEGTNYNLASTDIYSFLDFTGLAGDVNVLTGRFSANKDVDGMVSGGTKTFVSGTGFTLTSSTGEFTAPQNSRFSIKFKSDTEAVITIVKSYDGFQLDANGNAVIDNTKKVGNGVANSDNWIQHGNGANIYNVPTGQQHIFRQNGATVAGISGDGKFFVEGVGKGIILKSPDGTQYEITVPDGGGSLTVTEI